MSIEAWSSGDAEMDEEHRKLHQMVSSMTAVIRNDHGLGAAVEAVDVLAERMRIHFRMEEQAAARHAAPEACAALKADHLRLLRLLEPVRNAVHMGEWTRGRELLDHFHAAMECHDREMDIPLFRRP